MKRCILLVIGFVTILGVTASHGEWKLRVYRTGGLDEYALAELDSLTLVNDTTMVPDLVDIPPGVFIMGDGFSYCGADQREITLTRGFLLGQHEVTNQEYMEALQWAYDHGHVIASTQGVADNLDGCSASLLALGSEFCEIQFDDGSGTFYLRESPSSHAQEAYPNGYDPADHPVKKVTWFGSVRYCDWLSLQAGLPRAYAHSGDWACNGGDPYGAAGYRLPTDAEWEYAAQYDDERTFPWGEQIADCTLANFGYQYGNPCVGWTAPVGSYPDAPAALGLSDMAGNLREWCNDWHVCELGSTPETDPTGPETGESRVLRVGSWDSLDPHQLACAFRGYWNSPTVSHYCIGFRIARTHAP